MKTIVSVTPLRVQEDSRTFKIAASFARFGYESVVVEGQPSSLNRSDLPFRLIGRGTKREDRGLTPEAGGDEGASQSSGIFGGIGALLYRTARAIASLPFQLISVCDDDSQPWYANTAQGTLSFFGRLNVILMLKVVKPIYDRLPGPLKRLYGTLLGWVCFLIYLVYFLYSYLLTPLRCLPRASLYYLHAPYHFPAIYLVSKRHKVSFIYDAHDFYSAIGEKKNPTLLERRWFYPFLFRLERRCISRAEAVVTVCDGVARLQEEAFGCQPVVVRNCHDHRLDVTPKTRLREALGLGPDGFLLVAIGRPKEGRPIEGALAAIKMLPPHVHLAFLGKDTDHYRSQIQDQGLDQRVHVVPPVKPYEVAPFIASADASLILYCPHSANYENSLPNTFFQSIAAELPLLYPELPEIRKIARQYGLGIPINPLDPESIRAGIMRLMSDRDLTQRIHANLSVAKEELSWEREEIILRDLLLHVLEAHE